MRPSSVAHRARQIPQQLKVCRLESVGARPPRESSPHTFMIRNGAAPDSRLSFLRVNQAPKLVIENRGWNLHQ